MSAFVPSVSLPTSSSTQSKVCARRSIASHVNNTTPYFASTAFGAPLATAPVSNQSALRMEVTVVVGDNEPVESALRRFKKDVTRSGHLFELRRRRYFETNTEKRIRKAAASRRKAKMARAADNRSFNMS